MRAEHGLCIHGTGMCSCDEGYTGDDCGACVPSHFLQGGYCVAPLVSRVDRASRKRAVNPLLVLLGVSAAVCVVLLCMIVFNVMYCRVPACCGQWAPAALKGGTSEHSAGRDGGDGLSRSGWTTPFTGQTSPGCEHKALAAQGVDSVLVRTPFSACRVPRRAWWHLWPCSVTWRAWRHSRPH